MWQILKNRLQQGYRTCRYPKEEPVFPPRFRGRPILKSGSPALTASAQASQSGIDQVQKVKDPTGALSFRGGLTVDAGKLLFNEDIKQALPPGVFEYSTDYRMAVSKPEDLLIKTGDELKLASALSEKMRRLFGRSLKLREVCAGSCNGCDSEIQALGNVVFDLSMFGIQFVASPRHADGLMITGPVTKNMELALKKTYEAVAEPKIVIAAGACALSGGPFCGSSEVNDGIKDLIPVDLYIPGCPPHPFTILDGLLRLLGRLER